MIYKTGLGVDRNPYFYFDYLEYVLFADGLDSNIKEVKKLSEEYFQEKKDLYPCFQLHNLSPSRRVALQKFYNEKPSYLDILKPLMQPSVRVSALILIRMAFENRNLFNNLYENLTYS